MKKTNRCRGLTLLVVQQQIFCFLRNMGLVFFVVLLVSVVTGSVIELNELTLPRLNNGDAWLVVFYTTWCQFCQSLMPTLDRLAEKPDLPFHVARLDCTSRIQLCSTLGFSSWPSIVRMKNESLWAFHRAQRDESALAHFGASASDIAPDRMLQIPGVFDLLLQRLEKEAMVAREDLVVLYENYDDSVVLLAVLGVCLGFALGAATWRRRNKRKQE
jgi:thiol-disulfide isomerase/thioredoxin